MRAIYIIVVFCMATPTLGDVQGDRKKYSQSRLEQLRKQAKEKPVFQDIGTFQYGPEKNAPEIILSVKVIKMCKKLEPCKPLIWRERESGKLVQYESHNCRCDKAERIAAAKERQEARHVEWLKKQKELKEENDRWQKKRRQTLRKAALRREVRRIYDDSYIRSQYPCRTHRYRRHHRH